MRKTDYRTRKNEKKLNNQDYLISQLNRDKLSEKYQTPLKVNINFPMILKNESKIRTNSNQKVRNTNYEEVNELNESSVEKNLKSMPCEEKLSYSLINSPKLRQYEVFDYPIKASSRGEQSSSIKTRAKYYKDQPRIKNALRFPKDVFTPK
jgi:hypothetical protein